ncbi:MAG: DegT/DnrJ/EryC1/StrS family aminotransferase [Candidatus Omnitrophota bacterium]
MMYIQDSFYCLSFHIKKRIPIGRGGMILCNDLQAMQWFKKARYDGRDECALSQQKDIIFCGFNMYLMPEQAARGLQLFHACDNFTDLEEIPDYPDLSKFTVYKGDNK